MIFLDNFRNFLSKIFKLDEKYIIPKQGNWFIPSSELSLNEQNKTWIGYEIISDEQISTVGYDTDIDENQEIISILLCQVITTIALHFVGKKAQEWAKSIKFWVFRTDVFEELLKLNTVILPSKIVEESYDYIQSGLNTIKAWKVEIKLARKEIMPTGHININNIE